MKINGAVELVEEWEKTCNFCGVRKSEWTLVYTVRINHVCSDCVVANEEGLYWVYDDGSVIVLEEYDAKEVSNKFLEFLHSISAAGKSVLLLEES